VRVGWTWRVTKRRMTSRLRFGLDFGLYVCILSSSFFAPRVECRNQGASRSMLHLSDEQSFARV